ncbi:hypothetical protein [Kocuria sp. CH-021]|uniref:hypothetical protein n=1 Tax=Kocuria sp. CH-021 TaxID=3406735 RepID=UPI003C76D298
MTPSSTPGSPSPDDPMPWSDTGPHDSSDATRPLPPVSRFAAPAGGAPADAAGGDRDPGSGGDEDWSWYDEDDQHTRPLPAVTAQRPVQEDPGPRTDPAPVLGARGSAPGGGHGSGTLAGGAHDPGAGVPSGVPAGVPVDAATRHARQREEFGGLQLVPGFFGWLSAMALTWLLLALAGLAAAALGLRLVDGAGGVVDDLAAGSATAWTGAAALGLVEFLAFLGGGYAAGRMARFSGARQGVSVWLWSLFGRSVATVAGLVWADTVGLAPVGVSAQALIGDLLLPGLLAVVAVLVLDLLAAVLGGLWGVRYHRRVDRWGEGWGDPGR